MVDILIVGGGLAGLVNSILLSRAGLKVILIEKNSYPFHRVCGEYISNETIPFLEKHGLFPYHLEPATIQELQISSVGGSHFIRPLDLGGFGVSRYAYDHWLAGEARTAGVTIYDQTTVTDIRFEENFFKVDTNIDRQFEARIVIGAHGKRSKLDQTLSRGFLSKKSPYVGVKYHVKGDLPETRISLHNFDGGYCGVSRIENGKFNLCYLTHRDQIRNSGSVEAFESQVMRKNPLLSELFDNSERLFEKPEVINEITFDKQEPVVNHILMSGDAAGMITPLCGNGMAMAIHSAKILSELIIKNYDGETFDREVLERSYAEAWQGLFGVRLWAGRKIQELFGSQTTSALAVAMGKYVKPVTNFLITQTHGQPFS